nr:immunoglobulin light chain junction region [Macaca mulatta]
CSSYEGSNVLF